MRGEEKGRVKMGEEREEKKLFVERMSDLNQKSCRGRVVF